MGLTSNFNVVLRFMFATPVPHSNTSARLRLVLVNTRLNIIIRLQNLRELMSLVATCKHICLLSNSVHGVIEQIYLKIVRRDI